MISLKTCLYAFALIVFLASCKEDNSVSITPGDTDTNRYDPQVGNKASYFALEDVNGSIVKLNSYTGKVILLDFWATWCGPCMHELPDMKKLWNKYKSRDFAIISISLDDSEKPWKKVVADSSMNWINVRDIGSSVAGYYQVQAIPTVFLVDKKRMVRFIGHPANLKESLIDQLLKE